MQTGMDGFKQLFGNANPLLRAVRDGGMNLTDRITPLKHLIMRQTLAGRSDAPLLRRPATP
jgi:2-octaprenylphenol hydroxylase